MKKPPDYKEEASCCLNCEHFNSRMYKNCMKHKVTVTMASICSDYGEQSIEMISSDYVSMKKKKKKKKKSQTQGYIDVIRGKNKK